MLTVGENSLGDPAVRDGLVRPFLFEVVELRDRHMRNTLSWLGMRQGVRAAAKRLEDVVLGRDPAYQPVSAWNDEQHFAAGCRPPTASRCMRSWCGTRGGCSTP